MKKQAEHYERLVNAICMKHDWKVIEQPTIDALGESGVEVWILKNGNKGIVLLPDEDNQEVITWMIPDLCKRDGVFRRICECYVRSSSMVSLAELELKMAIRGMM